MNTPLTRTSLAQAGITIADAEGLGALTMRRVAGALGVATMSPYRHVTDRDDLLVAMVELIIRDRRPPVGDSVTWDAALRDVAFSDWDAFAQHPWLIEVWSTPRLRVDMGSFDQLERLLERLERAGVPRPHSLSVVLGVRGLTLGMASMAIENRSGDRAAEPELADHWAQLVTRFGAQFPDSHPRSTWFMTHLHENGGSAAFVEALDGFLGGVAARHGLRIAPEQTVEGSDAP
ncbi:hypothetical protein GCM10023094_49920 [Rhodococcus olei]|uniref:HTH tetR-type domain-containing protein n=1 Tax=Rhodococcus olei TaxID=2161675 RepID=A0ABP8PM51_9NOCA